MSFFLIIKAGIGYTLGISRIEIDFLISEIYGC